MICSPSRRLVVGPRQSVAAVIQPDERREFNNRQLARRLARDRRTTIQDILNVQ
jgi:hypothetical protein